MEIGDFAGAVQLRTSLVEEVPASAEFRLLRAQALESLGKREQALPDYFSTIQPSVI
jgi:hypothetical protein